MKPNLIAKIFIRYRFVVLKPSRAEPRRGISLSHACRVLLRAANRGSDTHTVHELGREEQLCEFPGDNARDSRGHARNGAKESGR